MFLFLFLQTVFALSNSQPALDPFYNNVVLIKTYGADENNQIAPGYCNGALIAPNMIVTAAHCVAQSWYLKQNNIQVSVGYYKYATKPDGTTFRVGYVYSLRKDIDASFHMKPSLIQKIQSHGLKVKINPEEDIAFIKLQQNLELAPDFRYAELLSNEARLEVLRQPLAYKPAVVTDNFMEEVTSTDTKRIASLNDLRYSGNKSFQSKSTSRVAPLDSGGPLFITYRGKPYILGVVKGVGQTVFGNWDVYTLAETW